MGVRLFIFGTETKIHQLPKEYTFLVCLTLLAINVCSGAEAGYRACLVSDNATTWFELTSLYVVWSEYVGQVAFVVHTFSVLWIN